MFKANSIVVAVAAFAGLASQSAMAVMKDRYQYQTGANMCTTSIPTTDSKMRPKATGFNNEGQSNAYVICTFDSPPGGWQNDFSMAVLLLKSLDGASHDVSCTGVNSITDGEFMGNPTPQYVTKTVTVDDNSGNGTYGVTASWSPGDFGAVESIPDSSGLFSVTCLLPPRVSVKLGFAQSKEDVGR